MVGAHLALSLLQKQQPVAAIRRAGSDIQKTKRLFACYTPHYEQLFSQIRWIDADVCDIYSLLEAFDQAETVYHCAGFISFDAKDRAQMQKINAEGTSNVVNACLEKNIPHLVHVSSIATLQNPDIKTNISETVYWKSSPGANDYAISKYNAEREVWRGIEEGLNATIVNPGLVIGPGFWDQGSGKVFRQVDRGLPFYTGGTTGYIDARDVAEIMVQLSEKKIYNKRFVLVEGNHSFREIFKQMAQSLGRKAPRMQAGAFLLLLGRFTDWFRALLTGSDRIVTRETIHAATDTNTYNNARIRQALDYTFIPVQESIAFSGSCFVKDRRQANQI